MPFGPLLLVLSVTPALPIFYQCPDCQPTALKIYSVLLGVALLDLNLLPSSGVGFIEVGLILVANLGPLV